MKKKKTITVAIIALNEGKKIGGCLDSVRWAEEILVVDTGSTDKTAEIAKAKGARVVQYTKGNHYSDWRNEALKYASGDWIFYVDADERVSLELRKEIISLTNNQKSIINYAYAVPRRNFIFGKEFKHSGQYPDYQKRLFLKSKLVGWKGEIHEEAQFIGELGYLDNNLLHNKHNNLAEMVQKTNKWSETEAKLMFNAGHPTMNIIRFFTAMWREFWLRMIKQKAFLDGVEGIIYANYQVFSKFVSYAKLWEMQQKVEKR